MFALGENMNVFYNMIEFIVTAYACLFFYRIYRRSLFNIQNIAIIAFMTIMTGEIVNSYFTKVTKYDKSLILWVPGTDIPIFVVAGGIMVSVITFLLAQLFSRTYLSGLDHTFKCLIYVFIISLFLPLIEITGINLGLWKWIDPRPLNFSWYLGVWKFYTLFIVLPAYVGVILFKTKYARKAGGR